MALQIIRQPRQPDDIGDLLSRLGRGLGTGIGSGLEKMAQSKLNQMQKRQQMAQLQEAGVSPSLANFIAGAPPKAQADLYSRLEGLGGAQSPNGIGTGTEAGEPDIGQATQPGMGQATQPGAPQVTLGPDPAERRHRENIEQKQRKEANKYINTLATGYKTDSNIVKTAEQALKIITKNTELFPKNILLRNLPKESRSNPKVRIYERKIDSLIDEMTEGMKGRPTEIRIKLKQSAKAAIDQPIETQKEALKDIIEKYSSTFDEMKIARKIKEENNGVYPDDIAFQVAERMQAEKEKGSIEGQINAFFKNREGKEYHEDAIKNAYEELPSLEETEMGDEGHNRGYKFKRGKNRWLFRGIA